MGFTVEEQILAVVVGILATFLANKLGADGSSWPGASMKSNLKEIITIQTELANAGTDIVEALKEATAKGQALFAVGDKGGLATLAERAASLRGAFVESYIDTHDMDPLTITLPLPDTDAAAVNLGTKDEIVKELSEEVTMKILTVERVTDIETLRPLPRDSKDPYYQYIYLTWTKQLGDVYVVVVNTGILGPVEYSKLSWNGVGSVYNLKVKKKTYDQLKRGECQILFTTENVSSLAATGIALKYGASIGADPKSKGTTFDSWICYSYTGEASVKA
jgi:hypothetical protein